jgi:undecaprenyl diphosphate synthase
MVDETQKCTGLTMNICMSYGSRGEIVNASRSLAVDAARGALDAERIDENEFEKRLLTSHCGDPDVLLRTSGEIRISNFLLWQLAYTEMFFVDKPWPAVEKDDLLEVIRTYAKGRIRRFGK